MGFPGQGVDALEKLLKVLAVALVKVKTLSSPWINPSFGLTRQ
jgi:hypothetical protein